MNAELPRPPKPNGTLLIVVPLFILLLGAVASIAVLVNLPLEMPLWMIEAWDRIYRYGPLLLGVFILIFAAVLAALYVNKRLG